jgi:hypothetical protein
MALCDVSGHVAKPTMETGMPLGVAGMGWIQVSKLYKHSVYTCTPWVPLDPGLHASCRR